jgi:hypothetical protein
LKKNIREIARSINSILWSLIEKAPVAEPTSPAKGTDASTTPSKIDIGKLIESLSRLMVTPSDSQTVVTTIESLKWILHLVNKQPDLVRLEFCHDNKKVVIEYKTCLV